MITSTKIGIIILFCSVVCNLMPQALSQQSRTLTRTLQRLMHANRNNEAIQLLEQDAARPRGQQLLSIRDRQQLLRTLEEKERQDVMLTQRLQELQRPFIKAPIALEPLPYEQWKQSIIGSVRIAASIPEPAQLQELINFFHILTQWVKKEDGSPAQTIPELKEHIDRMLAIPLPSNADLEKKVAENKQTLRKLQSQYARVVIGDIIWHYAQRQGVQAQNILSKAFGSTAVAQPDNLTIVRDEITQWLDYVQADENKIKTLEQVRDRLKQIKGNA